jgi:hypothetical protein
MVKQNPLQDLKAEVERRDAELTQSLVIHTEKTREANAMFGEKSIKAQTVGVEYTTPILYALTHLVIAYGKYTKILEKELFQ